MSPVITVYRMPEDAPEDSLERLTGNIQQAVANVDGLNIKAEDVEIIYYRKINSTRLTAVIDLLAIKPERTTEVLQRLRSMVADCLRDYALSKFEKCKAVSVVIGLRIRPEETTTCDISSLRCPDCKGRGNLRVYDRCPRCDGTGTLTPDY